MRIVAVGTGGVGSAFASIVRRRSFVEHCALADYEPTRPESVVERLDDARFSSHRIDASSKQDVVRLIRETRADAVLKAPASSAPEAFPPPYLAKLAELGSPHGVLELEP